MRGAVGSQDGDGGRYRRPLRNAHGGGGAQARWLPTAGDFAIELKVKEQQCFGSAGCNLTVEPKLSIVGNIPDEGTAEITFRVSGDESGPLIETIEADLSSGMYDSSEIFMGTSSSGIVPKAKITDVEYTS